MISSDYQPTEMVQRKALSQLIYKKIEDVFIIKPNQYKKVLEIYPMLGNLYAAIKEFYEIIYSKHSGRLEQWLNKLEMFDIPELQTYVNDVKKDIEAVKMELHLPIITVWQKEA